MRFLTEMYQTGQTPLREALNRLTADGLVECREQRGFYVADISRNELAELTKTRCWVESLALRESMAASTPQWEELLLLAEHRLSRTPRSLNTEHFEDNPEWERLHRVFHRTLIGNCAKVFVRDWGCGFDPATVADDRHGLRESITGRMTRHGGQTVVRTGTDDGEGTEIQLRMPR